MMIAGGALLFIASFLDWKDVEVWSNGDLVGLQWLFTLVIGAGIAVLAALMAFANVNLPSRVLGFSWLQLFAALGFAAFLITFGQQFAEEPGIGVLLGWIGAGVATAGAIWELMSEGAGARHGAPPTTF